MSTQLKLRRGTTVEHSTFTGAEAEVTVDTTKDTLVVHDGVTVGGHAMAKEAAVASQLDTKVGKDSDTGVAYLPAGTTAQRPVLSNGVVGIRYNTTLSSSEVGVGTTGATLWSPVGGGATGGGADTVFLETSYTVTQDYTITAGKSAITVPDSNGNVTIADGVNVTIPTGSVWLIPAVN